MNWDLLNANSGALIALFSAILCIVTGVYATLTWRLLSETRKLREAQTEPNVRISIIPNEAYMNFLDIVFQNIGLGPAYDIRFELDKDFIIWGKTKLSEFNILKNGLYYLGPQATLKSFLTEVIEKSEERDTVVNIRATFKNSSGKTYSSHNKLDFSEYVGLALLEKPPLYSIAEDIKSIREGIRKVIVSRKKLAVDIFTEEDREEQRKRRQEMFKERTRKEEEKGKGD